MNPKTQQKNRINNKINKLTIHNLTFDICSSSELFWVYQTLASTIDTVTRCVNSYNIMPKVAPFNNNKRLQITSFLGQILVGVRTRYPGMTFPTHHPYNHHGLHIVHSSENSFRVCTAKNYPIIQENLV